MKPLRFATLIRVSTEKQEDQGESLRVQTQQIETAVAALGGKVARQYGGQEHATPGWERGELDKLMADAQKAKPPFDAVMVAHPDRWSRDNVQSETGLRTLLANGVRFFVCGTEHDLHDPQAMLFLGMSAVIGQYVARTQAGKSQDAKVARARRGIPTNGSLPFGRTFDREALRAGTPPAQCWGLDGERAQWVREWAERYLEDGDGFTAIAADYPQVSDDLVRRTLLETAGPRWPIRFKGKRPGEHEVVTLEVPELLPAKVRQAIAAQCKANTTPRRPTKRTQHVLQGFAFCGYCNHALTAGVHHSGRQRYYRHAVRHKALDCPERHGMNCNGPALEEAVLRLLYETFGNQAAARRAIAKADPNLGNRPKLEAKLERARAKVTAAKGARERLVTALERGTLTAEDIDARMPKLDRDREAALAQVATLEGQLEAMPDPKALRAVVRQAGGMIRKRVSAKRQAAAMQRWEQALEEMSWEDKRELIETVFAGPGAGVYVYWVDGEKGTPQRWGGRAWLFELRGNLLVDGQGAATKGGATTRPC